MWASHPVRLYHAGDHRLWVGEVREETPGKNSLRIAVITGIAAVASTFRWPTSTTDRFPGVFPVKEVMPSCRATSDGSDGGLFKL